MTNKNIKLTVATVAGATALFASKGVLAEEATQPTVEPTRLQLISYAVFCLKKIIYRATQGTPHGIRGLCVVGRE